MSKLWDDLKDNMKEWGNAAVEKAEEVSKVAVAKTEELTKISKIKLDIHQLQRDSRREKEALGKLVYEQAKDDNMVNFTGNSEFFIHVEKISIISKDISQKENEINRIKAEYNIQDTDLSDTIEDESVADEEIIPSELETPEGSEEQSE
jgi:hypothetical protein